MSPLLFDGQKIGFDQTIPCSQISFDDLVRKYKGHAKKWVFQKEKYENGEYHWQGRCWLIHRKTCKALHQDTLPKFPGHWSLTCTTVHLGPKSFNYVMKEDTRVEGPWKDSDIIPERPPLTWQLEQFLEYTLRPYQQQIFDHTQVRDMRSINIVYEPDGDVGKSLFCEFLEYQGVAFECPPFRDMNDLCQFIHSFPPQTCYLMDMPRGMKKDKLAELYSGIEILKNGVCWDGRYSGKKRRMGRPNIWIFTNMLPVFSLMSKDRWVVWTITDKFELKPYKIDL